MGMSKFIMGNRCKAFYSSIFNRTYGCIILIMVNREYEKCKYVRGRRNNNMSKYI